MLSHNSLEAQWAYRGQSLLVFFSYPLQVSFNALRALCTSFPFNKLLLRRLCLWYLSIWKIQLWFHQILYQQDKIFSPCLWFKTLNPKSFFLELVQELHGRDHNLDLCWWSSQDHSCRRICWRCWISLDILDEQRHQSSRQGCQTSRTYYWLPRWLFPLYARRHPAGHKGAKSWYLAQGL